VKNESINSNEIAIVVLSFDGFHELWKPFFDYFFQTWNDCPYKIYLLNNFQKYDDERITNLLVGEDVSWSDSLKKGLEKIAEKRVFFLYDDAFIYQLDKSEITNCFQTAITNDYTSVMLRPSLFINQFSRKKIQLIPDNALYRNALFCNLIQREHLIKLLQSSESAWDFELAGNKRSVSFRYYSTNRKIIFYHHGIVKGKWFYSIYKQLKQEGYSFEKLNKSLTRVQSIQLNCKTRIYETFLRLTPIKIVRKIENKRKKQIYN
jgi:hypothetical protein